VGAAGWRGSVPWRGECRGHYLVGRGAYSATDSATESSSFEAQKGGLASTSADWGFKRGAGGALGPSGGAAGGASQEAEEEDERRD